MATNELHGFNALEVLLVVEVVVDAAEHLTGLAHVFVDLESFFQIGGRLAEHGVYLFSAESLIILLVHSGSLVLVHVAGLLIKLIAELEECGGIVFIEGNGFLECSERFSRFLLAVEKNTLHEIKLGVVGVGGDIFVNQGVGLCKLLLVDKVVDHITDITAVFRTIKGISLLGDSVHPHPYIQKDVSKYDKVTYKTAP